MTLRRFGFACSAPACLLALAWMAVSTLARPALAAEPSGAAPAAAAAPKPGLGDSVWLKDGTQLHGTVLRVEKGNYVLLLGVEGVRTIPWRTVARVENANDPARTASASEASSAGPPTPCCTEDVLYEEEPAPGAADWAAVSLGWDLRAEGVALFKHYTVDGEGTWYGGEGWGGGGSLSLHFRGPASLGSSTGVRWADFELGVTDSVHSVSWKEGAPNETKFTQNQLSMILGAHIASGRWGSAGSPWSGVVFGLAWLPTYVHLFGSDDFDATSQFHPAGMRFTVDWGRVSPTKKGLVPGMRASLTWMPYIGNLPTALSLGLGVVFF